MDSGDGPYHCAELRLAAQLAGAAQSLSVGPGLRMSHRLQSLAPLRLACHEAGGLPRPTPWIECREDASGLHFSTARSRRLAFERL